MRPKRRLRSRTHGLRLGYGKLDDRVWIGEDHKLPLAFGRDELVG